MRTLLFAILLFITSFSFTQSTFKYELQLDPIAISNLPGIHSYVVAQHNDKWLVIGGRLDGLHARQPFNAFSSGQNNTDIYVIDVETQMFWSTPIDILSTGLKEQLQSTNMNFIQDSDTLYIIGGYAYSATAADHKTFNNLTSVNVSGLINAVVTSSDIRPYFKQISDDKFAVTGGQMGKIGSTYYLVGGQRFDGRYNPMGHPTYTQSYTNQIRKFTIDNSGSQLSFSNYQATTDPVHLRRRDYNLIPQIFPDGTEGYTISSGVFQASADLPFLYPVDIKATGHIPQTSFNQYLSNYHSAKACLFDSIENSMHSLFFGGMSQYYYDGTTLIQDNNVPFVKTISRMTRSSDGSLQEHQLHTEMPALKGAGSEFIPNLNLPYRNSEILELNKIVSDTVIIGHIYGGIESSALNPFASNQTSLTAADNSIYAVKLIKSEYASDDLIDGANPYDIKISPNPFNSRIEVEFYVSGDPRVEYNVTDITGKMLVKKAMLDINPGLNQISIDIPHESSSEVYLVNFIFDNKYFVTKRIVRE